MTATLEAPKTAQPGARAASNMDDVLIFSTSDLRAFVQFTGTREGDNPMVAMFREVKNLRDLAQVAAKGQRSEVATAMEIPSSAPSVSAPSQGGGKGGGWSMA